MSCLDAWHNLWSVSLPLSLTIWQSFGCSSQRQLHYTSSYTLKCCLAWRSWNLLPMNPTSLRHMELNIHLWLVVCSSYLACGARSWISLLSSNRTLFLTCFTLLSPLKRSSSFPSCTIIPSWAIPSKRSSSFHLLWKTSWRTFRGRRGTSNKASLELCTRPWEPCMSL